MTDKPNFVLIPDDEPPTPTGGVLARLRTLATTAMTTAAAAPAALRSALSHAEPPPETSPPARPRLVFAVDATASREPAWAAARQVTDALVKALPGALDVGLLGFGRLVTARDQLLHGAAAVAFPAQHIQQHPV